MKKFVRKNTGWNVLASLVVILYMVGVAVNAILVKFNLLTSITYGKMFINAWAADYVTAGLEGFTFANIVSYLPVLGVAVGAFLLLLLPICFAKHGKGWNWIPLLLILADAVYYAKDAFENEITLPASNGIGAYFQEVFAATFDRWLTPKDVNMMCHVVIILFLIFGAAWGTKKLFIAGAESEAEATEAESAYRTITLVRNIAPFARTTAFDCWFNGENLSEIADGQEKSFLVDEFGADLVVVSPTGEESNIVTIPQGKDDETYTITTGRNTRGELRIELAKV